MASEIVARLPVPTQDEIVDSEGCKQVVKLMKPLRYPRRVVER